MLNHKQYTAFIYREWNSQEGHSTEFIYTSSVTPENPSGNKNLIEIHLKNLSGNVFRKDFFEYDTDDDVIKTYSVTQ
jgi:hypothetical protein